MKMKLPKLVIDGVEIAYHIDFAFKHACDCNADFLPEYNLDHLPNCDSKNIGVGEIKGWADRTFEKASKGEIDHEVLCQGWTYFKGTSFNPVVFLGFRKETAHMVEIVFDRTVHEKVVTQTLTGNPIELAKKDPILLTEIRSPFDESVESYVRERIKWLKNTRDYDLQAKDWEMVRNEVPGADAIEDEVEKVQGREKATEYALKNFTSVDAAEKSGSWYSFKTGRQILGFPCSYCRHMKQCYPQAELEMKGDRPVFVIPSRSDTAIKKAADQIVKEIWG